MKNQSVTVLIVAFFCWVVLFGCATSDSDDSQGSASSTSGIVGLWDASTTINGLLNVGYTRLSSSGETIYYDYLGDDYDKAFSDWGDCYMIQRERTPTYSRVSGNTYKVRMPVRMTYSYDGELLDKTYDVEKGADKMANIEVTEYAEITITAYIDSNDRLVVTSEGSTTITNRANKTIEELENYTRCPYSD